jgi:hypothetical protein
MGSRNGNYCRKTNRSNANGKGQDEQGEESHETRLGHILDQGKKKEDHMDFDCQNCAKNMFGGF